MGYCAERLDVNQAIREIRSFEWEGDYRAAARQAIKDVLETKMALKVDEYLAELSAKGGTDRRNGTYERHVLSEVGDVVLSVQRTRTYSAKEVVQAYRRRSERLDRAILDCFLLGASTRKVGKIFHSILGERLSAGTVSNVAKQLNHLVRAYHKRPLADRYRFLLFDGVVLKRRTGAGTKKRVVLVALGILPNGRKEVIDFLLSRGESQSAWEGFLNDLKGRGVTGEKTELVATDGGAGMIAALEIVYPRLPRQRCWAHKTRNVLNKVKKADHDDVKADLQAISHAESKRKAQAAWAHFRSAWKEAYPQAVACLDRDIESLLVFFRVKDKALWPMVRTTNAIERRFVEVRRRTRPMGVFSDRTSMERILYAVFVYENAKQGTGAPFILDTKLLT